MGQSIVYDILVFVLTLQIAGLISATFISVSAEFYEKDEEKEILTFRDKALQKGRYFYLNIANFCGISFIFVIFLILLFDKY